MVHVQRMLKAPLEVNDLETADAIVAFLRSVPVIHLEKVELTPPGSSVDILAEFSFNGNRRFLICEVKPFGQPRHVRAALFQLRKAAEKFDPPAMPIFIAPYLSQEAQALFELFVCCPSAQGELLEPARQLDVSADRLTRLVYAETDERDLQTIAEEAQMRSCSQSTTHSSTRRRNC